MKFYRLPVESRGKIGSFSLVQYRWSEGCVEAGQFVMARTPGDPVSLDPFLARPMTIYDHEDGVASLLFEVRGRGTAALSMDAAYIEVSAPLGRGFSAPVAGSAPVALLGGGVGAARLRLLSRRLQKLGVSHDVFLGFAHEGQAHLSGAFPGAKVATMDGSAGVKGTVLDIAGDLGKYSTVYVSGPRPMLAAVKEAAEGVPSCQIAVEERMACGNGSCNGCAVPVRGGGYLRACVEGPVFEARTIAW